MTLYEFVALELNDRMAQVNDRGEFIAADAAVPSNFYQVDGFYV